MKVKDSRQINLFDEVIVVGQSRLIKLDPNDCPHLVWKPSDTMWPGETFYRMTATCECCDTVRGRWPGEFYKR